MNSRLNVIMASIQIRGTDGIGGLRTPNRLKVHSLRSLSRFDF